VFGLPYRYGRIRYDHRHETGKVSGIVDAKDGRLQYTGSLATDAFAGSESDSTTEFLMERYTAFTRRFFGSRMFRVWHEPWQQMPLDLSIVNDSLLATTGEWFRSARFLAANYSPGVDVWMGRPLRVR
jgi:uncharacterized protein YqjF (DUF2071 family)